jgi:hypothetical protein
MRGLLGAAVLLAGGLLAGCSGAGPGWNGGGDGSGIRWSGPYDPDPGYGGGLWGPRYGGGLGFPGNPAWGYGGGRTFRPSGDVVCDRATATCYRDGEIDASDTRDVFGNRAARRVDRLRDQAGTNRIFRPDDDVVCNRRERVCYKDGHPDRSETRDFFGKKAARRVD